MVIKCDLPCSANETTDGRKRKTRLGERVPIPRVVRSNGDVQSNNLPCAASGTTDIHERNTGREEMAPIPAGVPHPWSVHSGKILE